MKNLLVIQAIFILIFYLSLFLIGYFYGAKLALLIFLTIISYQGYISARTKNKLKKEN